MNLQEANLLVTLFLALCQLLRGQSSYCSAFDLLIQNVNTDELSCQTQDSCTRLECRNGNAQLGTEVDLFDFRLLPCAEPSPAIWIKLFGPRDFVNGGGQRRVELNATLTAVNSTVAYMVGINGIMVGTYQFSVNVSNSSSNIGVSAQWTSTGSSTSTSLIDYTELQFNSSSCSAQPTETTTTTASPETTVPPETTLVDDTKTATNAPGLCYEMVTLLELLTHHNVSDGVVVVPCAAGDTPTGMNTDSFLLGTSFGLQQRPLLVLNYVLVCLTLIAIVAT